MPRQRDHLRLPSPQIKPLPRLQGTSRPISPCQSGLGSQQRPVRRMGIDQGEAKNSPQCGRCGHGCCTLYRVWTPARPPRPTGPVSPVRCPRGWPAAPPVPRCSKPDSPPPSARSPARSPFHSQGNPIHSSRRPSAAPKSFSLKVGWGWITADRSSAVRPF